jgi:hypothetical protein
MDVDVTFNACCFKRKNRKPVQRGAPPKTVFSATRSGDVMMAAADKTDG